MLLIFSSYFILMICFLAPFSSQISTVSFFFFVALFLWGCRASGEGCYICHLVLLNQVDSTMWIWGIKWTTAFPMHFLLIFVKILACYLTSKWHVSYCVSLSAMLQFFPGFLHPFWEVHSETSKQPKRFFNWTCICYVKLNVFLHYPRKKE